MDKNDNVESDMQRPAFDLMFMFLALMIISAGFSGGCVGKPESKPNAFEQWKALAEKSRGYSPAARKRTVDPAPKKIETIAPSRVGAQPTRPLPTRAITLKMHQTDVAVLLRALARAASLNIMINESVIGKISVNVKNARWDQVFTGILRSQALAYEWEGDILRIITFEDRDRNLKNLEAEQKIQEKQRELQMQAPMVTKIIPIDYTEAAKLKNTLETMLSEKQKDQRIGTIMVDEHTNSLIVQATPADIERIIPLIIELDRPIPQILIEAHIIETTSRTARELGIQWGGLYYNAGQNIWVVPDAMDAIKIKPGSGETVNPSGGSAINFPANLNSATQSGTGMFLGLVTEGSDGLLALQLSALEEEGKLNILSSPSITTLDNRKAIIESGNEVPIQTLDQDGNIKIEYKRAVLSLEVIPHVIQESALMLDITTLKDEIDFSLSRRVGGNPTILTKKAVTNVILFDGQTTVIGGLKKDTAQNSEAGVPWLKKIPILGHLFKNQGRSDQMEDLLIFITPYILQTRATLPAEQSESGAAPADPQIQEKPNP